MKIFILDKYKITKFNLPTEIQDSFLIPYSGYNNKNESAVTVEAKDGKWRLKSNGTINVFDGQNLIDSVFLENYSYYSLKILGQEEFATLFALPPKEEDTYKLSTKDLMSITIGSSQNANISYKNSLTAQIHAEIKLINNEWYLAGSSNDMYRTYVNEERVLTTKLDVGDVIFINGLKIIWMKTFIKINNPKQCVTAQGLLAYEEFDGVENSSYTPVSDEEANVDLYDEEDYFFHLPRIRSVLEEEEIVIDPPPASQEQEELPFILTLGSSLTMTATSLMSAYSLTINIATGKSTFLASLPQIIICVAMIIGSLILPRVTAAYQKKQKKKKEKKRQVKYKEYLDKKTEEINYILKKQALILKENNPTTTQCLNFIEAKNRMLWCREILHDDFLKIKLGDGNIPSLLKISAPQKRFTLDEDNLFEMVYEVVNNSKKLNDVPVTVSLIEKNVVSFVFSCSYKYDYIKSLILQLITFHSGTDLKLVILTDEKNKSKWDYVKFLPHCWSDDRTQRFFATNIDEINNVSEYLEQEYKNRREKLNSKDDKKDKEEESEEIQEKYKKFSSYYVIITDNYKMAKNASFINKVLKMKKNIGFSFVAIGDFIKELPSNCSRFVEIGEKEGCILEEDVSSQTQQTFIPKFAKNLDMNSVSAKLANIPLITKEGMSSLPTSLSFLQMYNVSKIEQLNISNRWKNNNPVTSLSVPIGVHENGEQFKLDLHEKFHGPHGLIAGSTGSGKSEFIITFILSMCVNYHPYEVQFVLIDYKGGGLAGAFENKESGVRVPHLSGTITNLDTAEMNRTLVSISSELKRRQRKFNEVKDKLDESTMDIYKYQRLYREGLIDEPMSHLFIISDEFAELKSQQPEFLAELVSTARIGRSLGVHLILATQKPSGVVSDQIWSNSKFKICLKVQDRGDSMEMLKRPEAASIKETGRFYLQVGYDDYFDIGQSGWGGAKYIPTDRIIKKVDDSISFIDNVGNVIKSINELAKKEVVSDMGDQLTNIVKHIYELGIKDNLKITKLWLDSIPEIILIHEVKQKYKYNPSPYFINPVIGEYDNPKGQEQGLLNLKITQENTLIVGEGGSGKENLLSTIIYNSVTEHTPDEVNIYVIDCGAEILKMFYKIPHVGGIATVDDNEKIMGILEIIDKEYDRRKDLFADYAGNYQNYIDNSGEKLPLIVVIINNYDVFNETYSKIADLLNNFYRDCAKYGISFIISSIATNSLRARTAQYFKNKIALRLPNKDDYRSFMPNCPKGLIPAKYFGRGIIEKDDTGYEFQTANICDLKNVNVQIKAVAEKLNEAYVNRAPKIKSIPKVVSIDTVAEKLTGMDSLPIGFNVMTKDIVTHNFAENKINLITGENLPQDLTFIVALLKQISKLPNINLKVVDLVSALPEIPNVTIYKENFEQVLVSINNEVAKEQTTPNTNVYLILGVGEIKTKLTETGRQILNNLFMAIANIQKSMFILVDNYASFKNLQVEQWYQTQIDNTNGIWLGANVSSQMAITVNDLTMEDRKISFPTMAFDIVKGKHTIVKYIVDAQEEG